MAADRGNIDRVLRSGTGHRSRSTSQPRMSHDSNSTASTVSTTSLVFERIDERLRGADDVEDKEEGNQANDLETGPFLINGVENALSGGRRMDGTLRKILLIAAALFVAGWLVGLFVYISSQAHKETSIFEHDRQATASRGSGKKVNLDQIMHGYWSARDHSISWISGPNGEDGLLLKEGGAARDYLVVEDVRANKPGITKDSASVQKGRTLMKAWTFSHQGAQHSPSSVAPSKNLDKVLIATKKETNWRYSSSAVYWILDVKTQKVQPLVPEDAGARLQLAQWSPRSDAVVFTRDNNMFIRHIGSNNVIQFTNDGGSEVFNGVPDWVYEEEVLESASATWWSEDGNYVAFLRTNETGVPEFPIQYFVSRPSGEPPSAGAEAYPEVRQLKYPKAGAHNPTVDLKLYDVIRGDVFQVDIAGGFAADDRLITTVVWAGKQLLTKETNRVSDVMRVALVDVIARTGKTVRTVDVNALDGGWFEISHQTTFVPANKAKERPHDGYIDTVIHDDGDHLAYFSPLDNPEPVMLTSGKWEVVDAPSAVDLDRNLVYFVATKESSIQRHVYQVQLTGEGMKPVTNTSEEAYHTISLSTGAGYGLLSYQGPGIPWQKVISTPDNAERYERTIEKNEALADKARKHELPIKIYGTINVDGVELNYIERRPPHFDEGKKYPVLFQQYSGPGSQTVNKRFSVDYQSYVASGLGYICVTVDGRGTGFIGRANRVLVRRQLGKWEAHDQIAAAKIWAAKEYVDESRLAIWGWSYGGYQTLKTLEQDAGQTFRYGMAVAPVTDWRFYDSIYTERYMLTPQTNAEGYDGTAIRNATALGQNVRFLIAHGVADDNVHIQNSLALLDRLDMARVENYDVHVFPDSDHSIYFHNANRIVYDKLTNWLINAFNGEWLKVGQPSPIQAREARETREEVRKYLARRF